MSLSRRSFWNPGEDTASGSHPGELLGEQLVKLTGLLLGEGEDQRAIMKSILDRHPAGRLRQG